MGRDGVAVGPCSSDQCVVHRGTDAASVEPAVQLRVPDEVEATDDPAPPQIGQRVGAGREDPGVDLGIVREDIPEDGFIPLVLRRGVRVGVLEHKDRELPPVRVVHALGAQPQAGVPRDAAALPDGLLEEDHRRLGPPHRLGRGAGAAGAPQRRPHGERADEPQGQIASVHASIRADTRVTFVLLICSSAWSRSPSCPLVYTR